jgi:hypothetical protein
MRIRWIAAVAVAALLVPANAFAQLSISGVTYTKWLWGNQHTQGSLYSFTTVPAEFRGDNGQGTEIELLLSSKPNKYVEVSGRLHSRFSQNYWTNFGGFGGINPALEANPPSCSAGACGEFDPRSNQYVKLRGMTVRFTPGYKWLDAATIGASDWGMFDAFTLGKIRYIDRDNASGLLFQGAFGDRKWGWDAARVSLPRLWAGPDFKTGDYHVQDAAYVFQTKYSASQKFDFGAILESVSDVEIDGRDRNRDDGRDLSTRFENTVYGVKLGLHPNSKIDARLAAYHSEAESNAKFAPAQFFGISGFSPVPAGKHDDETFKLNLDFNDPFGNGLSFNVEYFDIGADYVSVMAARREADVLLTEGSDGAFYFPGPGNAAFGVFGGEGNKSDGYGGWAGSAQQVATINVDNEFTDFDEPMAETVIGWKGITIVPTWTIGNLDLAGELTKVDYNTNWQAWGRPNSPIQDSIYPNMDSDAGVFGSFRNAYNPFQDRDTTIAILRFKQFLNVGKGVDLFGKIKSIDETDDRMTDARYLPYRAGDCPGGGRACSNRENAFNGAGNSTAAIYGNPPVITVNGVTGYQWKPFDSVRDDDKDLSYLLLQLGAGSQLSGNLYASLTFERYDVDLKDGNTAFQAYQLHEMASGEHKKNKLFLNARYTLGGAEFGMQWVYSSGTFTPNFGGGFVPQLADQGIQDEFGYRVGTKGFRGRFGGWNSLEKRHFKEHNLKPWMKVRF